MIPQRVLLTTDFSPVADQAFDPAVALIKNFGARLILVNVLEGSRPLRPDPQAPHFKPAQAVYQADLEREAERLAQLEERLKPLEGIDWRAVVGRGDPVKAVIEVAVAEKAEMLIISSHGRTGWRRMILGSVAEGLARHSPVPVLIWKHPSEE
jgi:nucleotide-binding universal stress UspA family protein